MVKGAPLDYLFNYSNAPAPGKSQVTGAVNLAPMTIRSPGKVGLVTDTGSVVAPPETRKIQTPLGPQGVIVGNKYSMLDISSGNPMYNPAKAYASVYTGKYVDNPTAPPAAAPANTNNPAPATTPGANTLPTGLSPGNYGGPRPSAPTSQQTAPILEDTAIQQASIDAIKAAPPGRKATQLSDEEDDSQAFAGGGIRRKSLLGQ